MPTRREFLASSAVINAAPAALPAQPFALRQIRLLEGPCRSATFANAGYLDRLEAGRLLHTFRLNAGLASNAAPLGGWEKPDCEVRGHFTGHFLSGCARMYAGAGDEDLKRKAAYVVTELAKCQRALGGGYLSAFPAEFFVRLRAGKRVWAPWYTLHKLMAGMLDAASLCSNEEALSVARGMGRWAANWSRSLSREEMKRSLDVEHGGVAESLLDLYVVTRDDEFLDAATRFEHRRILDPLAARRDELKGLHANTNIPKIVAAARRFEVTGEKQYRTIADFFWDQVTRHRSYATGGNSNEEHWRTPPGVLASELGPRTQECCCTYNMLRLTRHVFGWRASAECSDYYERALFNGILGTINPEDGMTMYFVPMAPGYFKLFSRPLDSFWCCTGTGLESFSKLGDSIYFHRGDELFVNLFIASELDWTERGVRVRQTTRFPHQPSTVIEFAGGRPADLSIHLRIPSWVSGRPRIAVNGKAVANTARPGSYATLRRRWSPGDRIAAEFPMSLRAEPLPDAPEIQAFFYGPVLLAGRLGTEGLTRETMYGDPNTTDWPQAIKSAPVPAPEFVAPSGGPAAWIKPAGKPLEFRTAG